MANLNITNTFVSGTTAKSSEVNQNFNEIESFVNSSGWVDAARLADDAVTPAKLSAEAVTPLGAMMDYALDTAPDGWLLCDGSQVSQTTYADLYAVFGPNKFGADTGGNFYLPDLRGRIAVPLDNLGGVDAGRLTAANTIGTVGGAEKHTLTENELAAHDHTGTTGNQSANHTHDYVVNFNFAATGASGSGNRVTGIQTTGTTNTANYTSDVNNQNHTHSFTTANAGGNVPHNNMQPYMILGKIIYAGV